MGFAGLNRDHRSSGPDEVGVQRRVNANMRAEVERGVARADVSPDEVGLVALVAAGADGLVHLEAGHIDGRRPAHQSRVLGWSGVSPTTVPLNHWRPLRNMSSV